MSSRGTLWLAAAAVLSCVTGCSSVTAFRGVTLSEQALYVRGVPPLRQDRSHSCGPVALAAVATHWGVPADEFLRRCPADMADASGRDLQELASDLGLKSFLFRGDVSEIRDNLQKGRPVIVMLPKPPDPAWRRAGLLGGLAAAASERLRRPPHWAVVVGLAADGAVILHDPSAGPLTVARAAFEQWWEQTDNLCLLVVGRSN